MTLFAAEAKLRPFGPLVSDRLHVRKILIGCWLAAAFIASGCEDDFGEECFLPNTAAVNYLCKTEDSVDGVSVANCAFTNSAVCDSRICASYAGSDAFCTNECDPADADACGSGAFCEPMSDLITGFCVPDDTSSDLR